MGYWKGNRVGEEWPTTHPELRHNVPRSRFGPTSFSDQQIHDQQSLVSFAEAFFA
jgi:hypothetical protein